MEGLVLAGSAAFKVELNGSDLFDIRLKNIVLKIVDVSYGGENGFNQVTHFSKTNSGCVQLKSTDLGGSNALSHVSIRQKLAVIQFQI